MFGVFGMLIAIDYRGFTQWHVRMTFRQMAMLRGPLSPEQYERRFRNQMRLERFGGSLFFVAGFVGGLVVLLGPYSK